VTPWSCGRCGRSGEAPDGSAVHFHSCTPPRGPRRSLTLEEILGIGGPPTPEELRRDAWRDEQSPFLAALARAVERTDERKRR